MECEIEFFRNIDHILSAKEPLRVCVLPSIGMPPCPPCRLGQVEGPRLVSQSVESLSFRDPAVQRRQSGKRTDTRAPWPKDTELEVSSFPLRAREISAQAEGLMYSAAP